MCTLFLGLVTSREISSSTFRLRQISQNNGSQEKATMFSSQTWLTCPMQFYGTKVMVLSPDTSHYILTANFTLESFQLTPFQPDDMSFAKKVPQKGSTTLVFFSSFLRQAEEIAFRQLRKERIQLQQLQFAIKVALEENEEKI